MPLVAALAISAPIYVSAYFDNLPAGLLASLGANVILNLPDRGTLMYRMTTMLACSFGMVTCFALGLIAQLVPMLTLPLVLFVSFWVAVFNRYYLLPPPAGLFVMMASMIALFMPVQLSQVTAYVGVLVLGSLAAGIIGCSYTLVRVCHQPIEPPIAAGSQPDVLIDSLIVACMITISLAVAMALDMPRPYWVPLSCYVIIQGMSFTSMWTKQIHRILGTGIGLVVAWALLSLDLDAWGMATAIMILVFLIETLIVRHYALAVVFVTPLTIFLVDSHGHAADATTIMAARFWDTALGCVIGVLGGLVILSPAIRQPLQRVQTWAVAKFHNHTPR